MKRFILLLLAILLIIFQKTSAQTPITYYPFNGNANDAIGSNNGTVSGATLTTDRFGNASSAYLFDGVNDKITAAVPTTATSNFSLTYWVKVNATGTDQVIIYNGNSSLNGYGLYLSTTGTLYVLHGNINLYSTGSTLLTGTWYHIAMVQFTGSTAVYVNGVQVFNATTSTPGLPNDQFYMSSNTLGTEYLNAVLDEVKVFTTALTGAQVLADYGVASGQNYRSAASGNWGSASTWEVFDGNSYIPAVTAPSSTDGVITIRNGHTVTVSSPVTADQLVIDAGGTIVQNADLTVADGTGTDLSINGSWVWNSSNVAGTGQIIINSGATANFSTSGNKKFTGSVTISNAGTIDWQDGDINWDVSFPVITNNGTFLITGNNSTNEANGGRGSIINNGIITKSSNGISSLRFLNSFDNNGTINLNAGTFQLQQSTITNTAAVTLAGGTLTINNSTFNCNIGSAITGTGTINNAGTINLAINHSIPSTISFSSTGNIAGAGNLTLNSDFTWSGNITGSGTLLLNQNGTWNGGQLGRVVTVLSGKTLSIATGAQKAFVSGSSITNSGTIDWQDGELLWDVSFPVITNNGTILISGNNNTNEANGGRGSIINNGTITKSSSGLTSMRFLNSFDNPGTINLNAGTFQLQQSTFTNTAGVALAGGTLAINNGTFNCNPGSSITGTGVISNTGTINLAINQSLPSTISCSSTGSIAGAGNLTLNSDFSWSGSITGTGALYLNENGTWNGGQLGRAVTVLSGKTLSIATVAQKIFVAGSNITNGGTIDWQDGELLWDVSFPVITNNGTFLLTGNNNTGEANGGRGSIINNGIFYKTSTGTSILNFLSLFNNTASGIIKGIGTISLSANTYTNNGSIAPGSSPGLLTINGQQPFSSSSTLQIELQNGSGAGAGHDQLVRNGNLTLAGTLTVTSSASVPIGAYTIINLTSGTISGSFSTVNIPPGTSLQINPTNVQLTVSSTLPLTLLSFSGQKVNNTVQLNWKTTNEVNVDRFEAEKSTDGRNFIKIATIKAGNTTGNNQYTVSDPAPFATNAFAYYRLKSIDLDGKFTISTIIRLSNQQQVPLSVFPNPAANAISISGLKGEGTISIISLDGRIMWQQPVTAQTISLDISPFAKGIYLLQYCRPTGTVQLKIAKQ